MNGVLVLDAAWRPERVVSLQRALTLLWDGKAVPATGDIVAVMRSPSITVDVPSVILLGRVAKWAFRRDTPVCSRQAVLTRDEHSCQFIVGDQPCRRPATSIDHLLPQSRGGQNTWTNLVGACCVHNASKADRTLEEMAASHGWSLKQQPVEPRRSIRLLRQAAVIPDAWLPFLAAA